MNAAAAQLGLKESHFVNPNGLPDKRQVTSARDMAMIGRALLKEFPEHNDLFGIGALQLGDQIIPTHNGLIGRYPGADGMRTGFTCAAGLNVVASATHGGRRLIVVVLGSSSARERLAQAEALLDLGFAEKRRRDRDARGTSFAGRRRRRPTCAPRLSRQGRRGGNHEGRRNRRMDDNDGDRDRRKGRRASFVDLRPAAAAARPSSARPRRDATHSFRAAAGVHRAQSPAGTAPSPDRAHPICDPTEREPGRAASRSRKNAPQRDAQVAPEDQDAPEDQAPPFTSAGSARHC